MSSALLNKQEIPVSHGEDEVQQYLQQIRIAKDVLHSRSLNENIHRMVKGLMIESYLEDGCQKVEDGVYGKSITDPCLGWEKTEKLILELAEQL